MPESIYLMGSEDVRAAGSAIRSAAEEMKGAASQMDYTFEAQKRFLDDWLQRLQTVLEAHAAAVSTANPR